MLIPLGFLDFPTGAASSFDLLQTYTLASSQASVTFSSLGDYAATYQHLQIRYAARTDRASFSLDPMAMRFNGDSGNNYSNHHLDGNGTSVSSYGESNTSLIYALASSSTAPSGTFGAGVVEILDPFETTKNKTARLLHGTVGGSNIGIRLGSGAYRSNSALTSVSFTTFLGSNILTGSRFSLYGLKAA